MTTAQWVRMKASRNRARLHERKRGREKYASAIAEARGRYRAGLCIAFDATSILVEPFKNFKSITALVGRECVSPYDVHGTDPDRPWRCAKYDDLAAGLAMKPLPSEDAP